MHFIEATALEIIVLVIVPTLRSIFIQNQRSELLEENIETKEDGTIAL